MMLTTCQQLFLVSGEFILVFLSLCTNNWHSTQKRGAVIHLWSLKFKARWLIGNRNSLGSWLAGFRLRQFLGLTCFSGIFTWMINTYKYLTVRWMLILIFWFLCSYFFLKQFFRCEERVNFHSVVCSSGVVVVLNYMYIYINCINYYYNKTLLKIN